MSIFELRQKHMTWANIHFFTGQPIFGWLMKGIDKKKVVFGEYVHEINVYLVNMFTNYTYFW